VCAKRQNTLEAHPSCFELKIQNAVMKIHTIFCDFDDDHVHLPNSLHPEIHAAHATAGMISAMAKWLAKIRLTLRI
jgi:hypothetical protein